MYSYSRIYSFTCIAILGRDKDWSPLSLLPIKAHSKAWIKHVPLIMLSSFQACIAIPLTLFFKEQTLALPLTKGGNRRLRLWRNPQGGFAPRQENNTEKTKNLTTFNQDIYYDVVFALQHKSQTVFTSIKKSLYYG